jgi:hypothetical protein
LLEESLWRTQQRLRESLVRLELRFVRAQPNEGCPHLYKYASQRFIVGIATT